MGNNRRRNTKTSRNGLAIIGVVALEYSTVYHQTLAKYDIQNE